MSEVTHKQVRITLYAGYTVFEYLAFAYFIFLHVKNKSFKKLVLVFSLVFFAFIVVYYLTVKYKHIDSIPIGIETIFVLIFSFYYLYEELNDSSTLFIYNKATFWIIFGIIIYLAGSFFIYIYANTLTKEEARQYWYITNIFSILKNIFFCIGILLHGNSSNQKPNYRLDLSSLN